MKKKHVKEVKMHHLLVCSCKSQEFAQSQKKFARSHDHEIVTFRNSVVTLIWYWYLFYVFTSSFKCSDKKDFFKWPIRSNFLKYPVICWARSGSSPAGSVKCQARSGQAVLGTCCYDMAQNGSVNTMRLTLHFLLTIFGLDALILGWYNLWIALKASAMNFVFMKYILVSHIDTVTYTSH